MCVCVECAAVYPIAFRTDYCERKWVSVGDLFACLVWMVERNTKNTNENLYIYIYCIHISAISTTHQTIISNAILSSNRVPRWCMQQQTAAQAAPHSRLHTKLNACLVSNIYIYIYFMYVCLTMYRLDVGIVEWSWVLWSISGRSRWSRQMYMHASIQTRRYLCENRTRPAG